MKGIGNGVETVGIETSGAFQPQHSRSVRRKAYQEQVDALHLAETALVSLAEMVGYVTIGALFLCSLAMVFVIVFFAVCGWMAMKDWRDR